MMLLKNNQQGSSMVEVLAIMAIIGVLAISSFSLISNLFTMFRQHVIKSELQEIQKKVSERFAAEGNFYGLKDMTAEDLVKEGVAPSQMLANGGLFHRLGGEVFVNCVDCDSESDAKNVIYYQIDFRKLSAKACFDISQLNWGKELVAITICPTSDDTYNSLTDGDTSCGSFMRKGRGGASSEESALPMTNAKAAPYCKDGSSIIWVFQ